MYFLVHVLVNSGIAQIDTFSCKENPHTAVTDNAAKFIIYVLDHMTNIVFPFLTICLGMFQVIVICVRIYIHTREQPSKAKCFLIFIDKSICHYSIFFANNAAAFFKKRISFSSSAFCCLICGSLP